MVFNKSKGTQAMALGPFSSKESNSSPTNGSRNGLIATIFNWKVEQEQHKQSLFSRSKAYQLIEKKKKRMTNILDVQHICSPS